MDCDPIVDLEDYIIGTPENGVNLYQIPNASMRVLEDIINVTWCEGKTSKAEFSAKIADAFNTFLNTINTPHVTTGSVAIPTVTAPNVDIPSSISVTNVFDIFTQEYIKLVDYLVAKRVSFMTTYFPDDATDYDLAAQWLRGAMANPDSGLPLAVQQQIWGEDHARISADKLRAQDTVVAQFASRRFPIPTAAATSAVMQIEQKAQDELAGSSRKIAILSVELQKWSVEKLLGMREMAMKDATEYVKALASGPDMVSRMVNYGYDIQTKLISSASQFYAADTNAKEMISKVSQYNNTITLEGAKLNQGADMEIINDKLKAMLAEAQSIAQMATSLFNNLHVGVTMQAGGTSVTTQAQDV